MGASRARLPRRAIDEVGAQRPGARAPFRDARSVLDGFEPESRRRELEARRRDRPRRRPFLDRWSGDVSETRCGFVAIIGAPNAGKSTLINALVGAKVSIVSRKAQTTRATVRGIVMKARHRSSSSTRPACSRRSGGSIGRWSPPPGAAAGDADVLALLIDARKRATIGPDRATRRSSQGLRERRQAKIRCPQQDRSRRAAESCSNWPQASTRSYPSPRLT